MTSAYDLLLKYVINLLKPKRPQVWRSIKTNNAAFKARVACMEGSISILRKVGYTEDGENSLQFPEDVQEPNKEKLFSIAAELLMAKLEVETMQKNPPPLVAMQQPHRDLQQQYQQQQQQEYQSQIPHTNIQEENRALTGIPDQYSNYPQGIVQRNQMSYSHHTGGSLTPPIEHSLYAIDQEVLQSRPV